MNENEMACRGADTVTEYHPGTEFLRCVACGRSVRWDLTENSFFGFQTCERKTEGKRLEPD